MEGLGVSHSINLESRQFAGITRAALPKRDRSVSPPCNDALVTATNLRLNHHIKNKYIWEMRTIFGLGTLSKNLSLLHLTASRLFFDWNPWAESWFGSIRDLWTASRSFSDWNPWAESWFGSIRDLSIVSWTSFTKSPPIWGFPENISVTSSSDVDVATGDLTTSVTWFPESNCAGPRGGGGEGGVRGPNASTSSWNADSPLRSPWGPTISWTVCSCSEGSCSSTSAERSLGIHLQNGRQR